MKHAGLDGIDDLFFEHQVFDVGPGDHDSLFSGKAFGFAGFKKPFVFWLTPPMAWICSFWLIDPVTAMPWRMGISDRLERMAYGWIASSLRVTSRLSEVIRNCFFGEKI